MGKPSTMEYAVTDGIGWRRQNEGPPEGFKVKKLPLNRSWNAFLATLPDYLKDGVKLSMGEKENVNGEEAIAINVSEGVLYFDTKSRLLVKTKKRMSHPLIGKDALVESVFSDFKKVSGIQFPHRITSYVSGKKILEMEIERIEFLDKVDDRLFQKP